MTESVQVYINGAHPRVYTPWVLIFLAPIGVDEEHKTTGRGVFLPPILAGE